MQLKNTMELVREYSKQWHEAGKLLETGDPKFDELMWRWAQLPSPISFDPHGHMARYFMEQAQAIHANLADYNNH